MANLINTIRQLAIDLEEKKQSLAASVLDTVNRAMDKDSEGDEGKKDDKKDAKKKLDKVDPKQAKGDFDDRKDKDIDNDGDTDKSDKYLHNRRKEVSKAVSQQKADNKDAKEKEKTKEARAKEKEYAKNKGKGEEPIDVSPTVSEEVIAEDVASSLEAAAKKSKDSKDDFMAIARMVKAKKSPKDIADMVKLLDDEPRKAIAKILKLKEEVELDEAMAIPSSGITRKTAKSGTYVIKATDKNMSYLPRLADVNFQNLGFEFNHKPEELEKGVTQKDKDLEVTVKLNSLGKGINGKARYKDAVVTVKKLSEEVDLDEAKELTPKAVEDYLVKTGVNPKDAKDAVKKGFGYANKKYGGETYAKALKKVAEVVWSLHEEVEIEEAKKDEPPFDKPYHKAPAQHKDRYGNTIKTKNMAKHLAKKGLRTVSEAEMTDAEKKKKEDIVKGMKKSKGDFEARYGDRAKDVMYATATKMAQKEDFAFIGMEEFFEELNM